MGVDKLLFSSCSRAGMLFKEFPCHRSPSRIVDVLSHEKELLLINF